MSQYVPKEITAEVNTTPVHPLVNFAHLLATVAVIGGVLYVALGFIASQLAVRIGPETEEKIGEALIATFPMQPVTEDSRVEYLRDLVNALEAETANGTNGDRQYPPLKVKILPTPEENAMVTAGSYLLVTEGLLSAVDSENELAFVLAHELGHLHHRDPLKALGRSLVFTTGLTVLGISPSNSVIPNVINFAELRYGRGQETAADDYAIQQIIRHYDHGSESLNFFHRNRDLDFDGRVGEAFSTVLEWEQTHPLSSGRIARLETQFEENGWATTGEITPLPEFIDCPNFEPCHQ
ncbi:MAG: M48 family metallopeptidase [Phormidesmis sp.]